MILSPITFLHLLSCLLMRFVCVLLLQLNVGEFAVSMYYCWQGTNAKTHIASFSEKPKHLDKMSVFY